MERDDRVLPVTRTVAALIAIVLVLATILLYGFPGETESHWSWAISPDLTAMFMGAGYACGAYYFIRVFRSSSWRAVGLGLLPITVFTVFLLLATVIHWDLFNHGHPSFWMWTFLYVVTPVLVPGLWLANRGHDPGLQYGELAIPAPVRGVFILGGAALVALAVFMFLAPAEIVNNWLWQLSELTARTLAAFIVLTGGLLLVVAYDGRWVASRVYVETLVLGTVLMSIAVFRDWGSLDERDTVRWAYLASLVLAGILLVALYVRMELQTRSASPVVEAQ